MKRYDYLTIMLVGSVVSTDLVPLGLIDVLIVENLRPVNLKLYDPRISLPRGTHKPRTLNPSEDIYTFDFHEHNRREPVPRLPIFYPHIGRAFNLKMIDFHHLSHTANLRSENGDVKRYRMSAGSMTVTGVCGVTLKPSIDGLMYHEICSSEVLISLSYYTSGEVIGQQHISDDGPLSSFVLGPLHTCCIALA